MKRLIALFMAGAALMLAALGCSIPKAAAQTLPTPTPTATAQAQQEQHPWIGIAVKQVSAEEAAKHNLGNSAIVVVAQVVKDGPAATAGLQPKDILVSIGGTSIATMKEVLDRVGQAKVGEKLSVKVLRGDDKKEVTVDVVVGQRPQPLGPKDKLKMPNLGNILGQVIPELKDLGKVAPKDRFEHFLGGEFSVLDSSGNKVRVQVIPGTVGGVSGTTLTYTPNGSTAATSLTVGQDVPILNLGRKLTLADLKQGDKIVLLLVNGQVRLVSVGAETFAPMMGPMPDGMGFKQMVPGHHRGFDMPMPEIQRQREHMGLDKPQAPAAAQGPVL